MPSIVQLGTQQAFNTTNPDSMTLNGVTAGNRIVACFGLVGTSVTVSSITDANVTWTNVLSPITTTEP